MGPAARGIDREYEQSPSLTTEFFETKSSREIRNGERTRSCSILIAVRSVASIATLILDSCSLYAQYLPRKRFFPHCSFTIGVSRESFPELFESWQLGER